MNNRNKDNKVKDVLKETTDNMQEISEVVKWFATDEGQDFLSNDIDESIESLLRGGEEGEFMSNDRIPSDEMFLRINRRIRFHHVRRVCLRVAAVVVPLIVLAGIVWYAQSSHSSAAGSFTEIYVPKGAQQQITLADGSRIYLGSEAYLRYPQSIALGERKIYFRGEGYFIVEKDAERPFVVETDKAKVNVLGTSFHLKAYPEESGMTVQLDEGSIRLTTASPSKEYTMVPGEKLTYNYKEGTCVIARTDNAPLLKSWEDEAFSFRNAPLAEVLESLRHWYDIDFQVEDASAWEYSYTFEAKRDALEEILSDMEKVSPIRFQNEGNEGKVLKIFLK